MDRETPVFNAISDRVLDRLPGSRLLWIGAWAAVPWANAGANLVLGEERSSPIWEQDATLVVLSYVSVSLAIAISLVGANRITRRLTHLLQTTSPTQDGQSPFRGTNSVAGPLVASFGAAALFGVSTLARHGWQAGVLRGATWLVVGLALSSFLWTYASLLLGLDRLGRARLDPASVNVDPGLGLQPLGNVASSGLWMLLAWLVPVLLTGLPDVVGAVAGMLVLAGVLTTFFLSLIRLHRQMVRVKAGELAFARDLYAQAYEPVRRSRTLESLERQRALLAAADALEKRAKEIHEWPFSERTPTLVITIATSVTAMTIGRLILDPLGL